MSQKQMVVKLDREAFKRYQHHMKEAQDTVNCIEVQIEDLNTHLANARTELANAITIEEVKRNLAG